MAHIFLQEDPKVSVADANDVASTIPTPEQLGSLLLTYAATGSTGQAADIYAALAIGGTAQWVPVGAGSSNAAGPSGIDHVTGDVTTTTFYPTYTPLNHSNAAPSAISVAIDAPQDGFILADFDSMSSSDAGAANVGNVFRLLLDGVPIDNTDRGTFIDGADLAGQVLDCSINTRVAVTAGPHTIKVEWAAGGSGFTAQILRGTDPGFEGATLRAMFIAS